MILNGVWEQDWVNLQGASIVTLGLIWGIRMAVILVLLVVNAKTHQMEVSSKASFRSQVHTIPGAGGSGVGICKR